MPPMPPMPPPGGIAGADLSSGLSATMASVVSIRLATEAAFCSAVRTTLVGSMMPAFSRSSYSSAAALKPNEPFPERTLSRTMEPSAPAFFAIQRSGSSMARRTILTPKRSSSGTPSLSSAPAARSRATPPPAPRAPQQAGAAPRHDPPLDGRTGGVERILHPRLLLLHLHFRGRTDLDHRDA